MRFLKGFWNRHLKLLIVILFFLAIAFVLIARVFILRKAIASANKRIQDHHYTAHWDNVRFKGLRTLFIKGIIIEEMDSDNELVIDSLLIKVRIVPLFIKRIRIKKMDCRSLSFRYFINDTIEQLPIRKKSETPDQYQNPLGFLNNKDFAGFTYKNIRRFFNYVPDKVILAKTSVKVIFDGKTTQIAIRDFNLDDHKLRGKLNFNAKDSVEILLKGNIDKKTYLIQYQLDNSIDNILPLPILKDRYGFEAGFDTLNFQMSFTHRSRQMMNISGFFNFHGFELNGDRLSTDNIKIDRFRSSFKINVGNNFIEIDSSSVAWLNLIRVKPYIKFSTGNQPTVIFRILPEVWSARDFFNSLPNGIFTSLQGFQADGLLHYYLDFSVNLDNPDSLSFNTKLTGENLNIVHYGNDDYRILNGNFRYNAYENGRMVSSFIVGPENPDFIPYEQISPYVRAAVMTSEDGSFFFHNGFNPNAFRESISTNIKEGRFARGGSTISMQLVKNVFLTRNKTLARKVEEALIVWLIESKNLVSKQRMYEVYLNIIEWGPGIYGINQASHFYFDKPPSELDIKEGIYLASIVPHPKWYKYSFDTSGTVRPFYHYYFNRMKELMVRREFILPSDTLGIKPGVILKGKAKQAIMPADPRPVDLMELKEVEIFHVF